MLPLVSVSLTLRLLRSRGLRRRPLLPRLRLRPLFLRLRARLLCARGRPVRDRLLSLLNRLLPRLLLLRGSRAHLLLHLRGLLHQLVHVEGGHV